MGGESPAIILKGADLELALSKVLDKMYLNTGQSCSALSRLFIPIDEKEKIEQMIIDMTKKYNVGDVAKRLKAGNVIINHGSPTFSAPFGVYKHSGIGRNMV